MRRLSRFSILAALAISALWLGSCSRHKVTANQPIDMGNITIGNDVWIGNDVTILSGVTIGDGAVIAAGAVVAKDVMPYDVVGGVPAKVLKSRWSGSAAFSLRWWDWPLEKLAVAIPILMSGDVNELFEFNERWEANQFEG